MFSKFLSKKENSGISPELIDKIAGMNLSDMRIFVKSKQKGDDDHQEAITEIMRRLTSEDDKKKFYIKSDDEDSKKKKAFELIILIASGKKLSLKTVDLMQKFMDTYEDIINEYDREHKEIYMTKLNTAIFQALNNLSNLTDMKSRMNYLGK